MVLAFNVYMYLLVWNGVIRSIHGMEIIFKRHLCLFPNLVPRFRIWYHFYHTTLTWNRDSHHTNDMEWRHTLLTPQAVATTRYGTRYRLSPAEWNTSLNNCIICRANISCLTSSPTLNIEACHTPLEDN